MIDAARAHRQLGWLFGLAACSGCAEPPQAAAAGAGATPTPIHAVYGCASAVAPTCTLLGKASPQLRLWLDQTAGSTVEVRADGVVLPAEIHEADGGQLVRVRIPVGASSLVLHGVAPMWDADIELSLTRVPVPALLVRARRAAPAERAGLRRQVAAAAEHAEGVERMLLLDWLRDHDYEAGDVATSLREAEQVAALADQLGYPRHYADATFVVFYGHYISGDLAEAERWAGMLVRISERFPELGVHASYQQGLLAAAIGDIDAAQRHFAETVRLAAREGDSSWMAVALPNLGVALAELGRGEEARAVARRAREYAENENIHCGERLRILDAVAWTSIQLAQAERPHDPPHAPLERMRAAAAPDGECPDPAMFDNARISMALYHLIDDEPELARAQVDDLLAAHEDVSSPWVDELVARVGLATGRWEQVPETLPETRGDVVVAWLAALRHAETLERFGLDAAAVDAYVDIENRLDASIRRVGVDAGQERFLAMRSISARRLVDAALRLGDDELALCRARLAISRAVEASDRTARTGALSPEQRIEWTREVREYQRLRTELEQAALGDWSLAADELARVRQRRDQRLRAAEQRIDAVLRVNAAPSGCARLRAPDREHPIVVAFEATDDVVVFVADGSKPGVTRLPRHASVQTWAHVLARPLAALSDARRITMITGGSANAVPLHALVDGDAVLLEHTPIVYGLDLPLRPAAPDASEAHALVVADPTGDLAQAIDEAQVVTRRLTDGKWQVVERTRGEATRARVVDELGEVALFHYAGHGSRGAEAWDAALRLAENTELRGGDILALPRVPASVVLAGCHTGRRDDASLAGGMNLGRAFVLAGADEVLVADAEIGDDATLALAEALYDTDGAVADLPAALRRAQARLRERGIDDWAAFRVLVP